MDEVLEAIKCAKCFETLSNPVLLPCGQSICKHHIDKSTQSVMCNECNVVHSNWNFPKNKALSKMIAAQIGSLDFGQTHKEAKNLCGQLSEFISEIGVLLNDPEYRIHELFSELRRKVDLKHEELKLKLEQETQRVLTELDNLELECKKKLNSSASVLVDMKNEYETARQELENHLNELNELKVDENKWKAIQKQCRSKNESLLHNISSFDNVLYNQIETMLEKLRIDFHVKIDIDPLIDFRKINSEIITNYTMEKKLLALCEFSSKTNFKLLYRGSRDGFGAKDFSEKCDQKAKTLTIIKSTAGFIFGGYAEATWSYNGSYVEDSKAFLFSLVNKDNQPLKINVGNDGVNYAIASGSTYACVYGGGCDLAIANYCNQNTNSYSYLGRSYKHPTLTMGSEKAKTFLAGSYYFQVAEIEIYHIV